MDGLVIRTCAATESAVGVRMGGSGNSDKPEVGSASWC